MESKSALLIAGGGTLGTYTAEELLRLGHSVDVLCPEEKVSNNKKLHYIKGLATEETLKKLVSKKHYNGIVNFIHYVDVEEYKPVHKLLSENTDHLIFLSSYRVYADLQHPITESAPMLVDVLDDADFLQNEPYAAPKARAEKFLRNESQTRNWTAVRPVISFSKRRFDVVTRSRQEVVDKARAGDVITLPRVAKDLTAGLDWAGNSGKLIANLLFKEETFGESYTISSGENLTWGEVAEIYTELLGAKFQWIDTQPYIEEKHAPDNMWILTYDRFYDRVIDNSKVLKATGLKKEDLTTIKDGVRIELRKLEEEGLEKDILQY